MDKKKSLIYILITLASLTIILFGGYLISVSSQGTLIVHVKDTNLYCVVDGEIIRKDYTVDKNGGDIVIKLRSGEHNLIVKSDLFYDEALNKSVKITRNKITNINVDLSPSQTDKIESGQDVGPN